MGKLKGPLAGTMTVEEVVERAQKGEIRVPLFQRSFRWGVKDVMDLFDSILKGYPIGNLLLWQRRAPAQDLRLGDLQVRAPEDADALFLVDGQQRVTSLVNVLIESDRRSALFDIAYDPEREILTQANRGNPATTVPLPIMFSLPKLLEWMSTREGQRRYVESINNAATVLRQYRIPVYTVASDDESVLQDIFDRMNNSGKRLSRAEVFHALHPIIDGGETKISFSQIATELDASLNWGCLSDNVVMNSLLSIRHHEIRREIRAEFTDASESEKESAYRAARDALRCAIKFLRDDAKVPHLTFLPYQFPLVVLARFFAHHPAPSARNRILLTRWYWRTVLAGLAQFTGGTANATAVLGRQILKDPGLESESKSIEGLLGQVPTEATVEPVARFQAKEAVSRMWLCSLWALGPCSPENGERYEPSDLSQALLDAPTATPVIPVVPLLGRGKEPARRCFLIGSNDVEAMDLILGRYVASHSRGSSLIQQDRRVLQSHGFSSTNAVSAVSLEEAGTRPLVEIRTSNLNDHYVKFVSSMCGHGLEDTPDIGAWYDDE